MKKNSTKLAFLGVAAVWLGGHFGPGFATGGFSMQWYVQYGWVGIFTPLIAMLVTGGVMYFMTEYARSNQVRNYKPFAVSCYGEKGGKVAGVLYDITFLLTVFCAGGLAVSGEQNILKNVAGVAPWISAVITIILSALLCLYGSKLLSKSSKYMMYAIVAVVLLITVMSFALGQGDLPKAFAASVQKTGGSNIFIAILNGILYGCFQSTIVFNVMSVSDLLADKKETKKAIGSGYIITVVLMICFVLTLFSYTAVEGWDFGTIPVLSVLNGLGQGWLTWLFVLLMSLAVLSSTAGLAFAGTVRFDRLFGFIKNAQLRRFVITVILLGIAALGASMGFGDLLKKGTSLVGYIGIPVLVIPAFTWVSSKLKTKEN